MKKIFYVLLLLINVFLLANNIEVFAEGPYTVKYRVWDENTERYIYYDDKVVDHGDPAPYFEPILVGYDFIKWDVPLFNITEDTVATAVIKIKEYTVTFIDYDGTVLSEDTVTHGTILEPMDDPVRDGYEFIGWDSEDFEIIEDATFTALYKEVETEEPDEKPEEKIEKVEIESGELEYKSVDLVEVPHQLLLEKITEIINNLDDDKHILYFPVITKGVNVSLYRDSLLEAEGSKVSLYINLNEINIILDPNDLNSILINNFENLYLENKTSSKEMEIIKVSNMDGTPITNPIEINILTDETDAFFADVEVEYKPVFSSDGLFNGYEPKDVRFVIYDEVKDDYKLLPTVYDSQKGVYYFSISKNSVIIPVELTESIDVVVEPFDPIQYIKSMDKSILTLAGVGLFALIYGTIYVSDLLKEKKY